MVAAAFDEETPAIIDNCRPCGVQQRGKGNHRQNGEFKTKVELGDEYGIKRLVHKEELARADG